ncbi:MAG: DUF883 domain-containing protein [Candidatus Jettenia sp.]|uniref:DUF883 domain-containing protein n=1 Tax=Candidatus Jettenia caeni TaxID=247490 RepID=I3IKK0_9BACT|nr:hypothetical protein [Candidatus Jettenia sp. AMX1]MBC6929409.1 DUF883 domain-containing protein [Candidatus Jettenia sp.]NUN22592.1 DUF883 domain-containing protein [Candidatus Jettenia caeni]KAA0247562.1 MAG: DUF883 domain-containing protein [Candidatus Jettenia sp. AMX1]MCE7880810.1 DUF883 domain-containing protein [Candidatus Jettenia sp. AMX1]MCQ3927594.1 DUF883 domain-containing protein [Candidatus Jettenia sp.]
MGNQAKGGQKSGVNVLNNPAEAIGTKEAKEQRGPEKITEVIDLLNEAVQEKKEEFNRLITEKYSHIKDMVSGVTGENKITEKIIHNVSEALLGGEEKLKGMTADIDKKVRENPWLYLGLAAAGFFLWGYMTHGSKSPEEK